MPRVQPYYVHISDVQRFKKCRRLWSYASPLKANLAPKETYSPFWVGTLVHHGLEHHYRFGTPPAVSIEKLFSETKGYVPLSTSDPAYPDYRLALVLTQHYLLWQKYDQTPLADANMEFVAPEQEFTYPIFRNTRRIIYLKGRFDGIVRLRSTGRYYLWEIKTTRSITERLKQLALDSQTDAYLLAANHVLKQQLGINAGISGVIYTLLRKREPASPDMLTNGTLSQKKLDTTAFWYLDCVKRTHPDWSKQQISETYGSYINALLQSDQPYFSRTIVTRSTSELNTAFSELVTVAREMIDPLTPTYYNPTEQCNWCLFRTPCIMYQQGGAVDLHLQLNYRFNSDYEGEQLDG